MKNLPSVKGVMALIAIFFGNLLLSAIVMNETKGINNSEPLLMNDYLLVDSSNNLEALMEKKVSLFEDDQEDEVVEEPVVYLGMTLKELANKLDKNLKSTLTGYGMVFAKYSLKYEVDPYVALAIVLHETGCGSGRCSTLTSSCYNIGGMKGTNKCGSGPYARFRSLEAGIEAFFKNLSSNYYKKGLKTPEQIGKKYAESSTWASRIRFYVNQIQNS
ncbi:MAG: glucosaminidase domain-containing protein [Bacilli bacterium]|jgi:hypothetical protein|nr:glucosaminidase domain-containing protein [Bacilli bacterium]